MSPRGVSSIAAVVLALAGAAHAQPGLTEPVAAPGAAELAPIGPEPEPTEPTEPTGALVRLELGGLHETTRIGAMVGTVDDLETGILPDAAQLTARGLSFRVLFGHRQMPGYLGVEASVGWLEAPPTVLPPRSGIVPSTDYGDTDEGDWSPDTLLGMRFVAGGEGRLGPLFVGGEIATGLVSVQLGGETEGDPWVHDPRFVLDLRGRAGLWLTPNVSVALMTSTSVVRPDERSVHVMLGFAFGE